MNAPNVAPASADLMTEWERALTALVAAWSESVRCPQCATSYTGAFSPCGSSHEAIAATVRRAVELDA